MNLTKYQKQKIKEKKRIAYTLYKEGLTTRQIGKMLEMSHGWVSMAINDIKKEESELSTSGN